LLQRDLKTSQGGINMAADKVSYTIRIRSMDAIADYVDNTLYILPNKPWKDKSLYKFLYLFMEQVLNIPKFKIISDMDEMDKLVAEAQEKEKNVRFMEIGVITFLPTIAVFRYNIILPKHLTEVFSEDYYNKWKYAIATDINVEVGKNKIRKTQIDLVSFRRGKLKLEQLKQLVINEIQNTIRDKKKLLILDKEGEQLFEKFVEETIPQYLFPSPRRKDTKNTEENKQQ
jgi:hypothetical protein